MTDLFRHQSSLDKTSHMSEPQHEASSQRPIPGQTDQSQALMAYGPRVPPVAGQEGVSCCVGGNQAVVLHYKQFPD